MGYLKIAHHVDDDLDCGRLTHENGGWRMLSFKFLGNKVYSGWI